MTQGAGQGLCLSCFFSWQSALSGSRGAAGAAGVLVRFVDFRPLIEEVTGVLDDVNCFKVDTGCVLAIGVGSVL
jgi:hypothetical protein